MVFTVRAIIEVIGHPESHVNEIARKVLENLKKEQGVELLKENVAKAEMVKNEIFASHLDVELKILDMTNLLNFCYEYLPSSIEVLDADKVIMPVRELSAGISEMLRRLHAYNLMLHNLTEKNKELAARLEKQPE